MKLLQPHGRNSSLPRLPGGSPTGEHHSSIEFLLQYSEDDLPFTVELWSSDYERLEETLARVADFLTAKSRLRSEVQRPAR